MSEKDKQLLVDTMSFRPTGPVLESKAGPGKYVARGEFARADRATENKRLYPHRLWERELDRLGKQLSEMKVYGELDHPMDGRTQLKRASHIVTDLRLEGDVVVGCAHILDTDQGRNLKAILDAGGAVGVSSRGFGTTKPNMKGESVVQDDYRLMTFDFVAEPAQQSAYPEVSVEHVEPRENGSSDSMEEAMAQNMTFEQLKESNPELAEHFANEAEREYERRAAEIWAKKITGVKQETATDLRAEFAEKLEAALGEAKKEMEESIRERLMNDPRVAGARKALDEMKSLLRPFIIPEDVEGVVQEREQEIERLEGVIAEKDLKIANLQGEADRLAEIAREAGYRYHLEQSLHGVDHSDLVRELIGDVTNYGSLKEMDERVVSIVEEIDRQKVAESVKDERVAKLEEDLRRQKEIAEKALEASRTLAAQVYLEQRLANHPNQDYARSLVEAHHPQTKEEVDHLLTSTRPRPSMTEDVDAARARVRSLVGSNTREYLPEEEQTKGSNGHNGAINYNGLGADLSEIRALSGLPDGDPRSN